MSTPFGKHHALNWSPHTPSRRRLQGMALIEALVASAVLGIGLAAATRLTLHTLHTASDTRQRTVALALALDAMDCHQSGRTGCALQVSNTVQGTAYRLQVQLQTRPGLAMEDLLVRVQWPTVGPALGTVSGSLGGGIGGGSGAGAAGQAQPRTGELVVHSSRDAVPVWLGVSLP
jgi:type II secretory pathway pseudopilin PulG